MEKWCVFYSSVTGNTRKLADVAAQILGADLYNISDSESQGQIHLYDCIMVGYWIRRGAPDSKSLEFLSKIANKKVALFQTHGAYVGSDHAITAFARAGAKLGPNNTILGTFSCQGAVSPTLIKLRLEGKIPKHRGENLEDCQKRWAQAANHPDENDLERMRIFAKKMQSLAEKI